jgi:hypothetical protein
MRRWLRRLGWSLVTSLVLLTALVVAAPWLLKPTLNQWANQALQLGGLGQGKVHIRRWSWYQLHIDRLHLTFVDGSQLQLNDLRLNYRPLALLQGEFQQLRIARLSVQQASAQLTQAAQRQAQRSGAALLQRQLDIPPLQQWLQVPLGRIQIDRLNFNNAHVSSDLKASFDDGLWRLHGAIQLDNAPLPWQLEAQLQIGGAWLLLLSEQQQRLLQWHGHIAQQEGRTELEIQQFADLALLRQRLPALESLPIDDLQGNILLSLPNQARLPDDIQAKASWQLNSNRIALADGALQPNQWQLSLDKLDHEGWQAQLSSARQQGHYQQAQFSWLPKLQLHCHSDLNQCTLDGQQQLYWQQTGVEVRATLASSGDWNSSDGLTVQLPLQLQAQWQTQEHNLQFDAHGQWQLHWHPDQGIALQSTEGLALTTFGQLRGWQLPPWRSQWLADLQLQCQPDCQLTSPLQLSWQPVTLVQPDAALTTEFPLLAGHAHCQWAARQSPWLAHCQLTAALAKSQWQGWQLADNQLQAELMLSPQQLQGQLNWRAGQGALQLHADVRQQYAGEGHIQWYLKPTELAHPQLNLNQWRSLTGVQWLAGQVSGQGWLDWQANGQLHPDTTLRLTDVSASYDNRVAIEGWHGFAALRRRQQQLQLQAQLSGDRLNPGIALTDSLLRLGAQLTPIDINQPWQGLEYITAELHEGRTRLLGGSVRIPEARFDSRKDINAFGIVVDHIELQQLAALEAKAQVNASGVMDGVLPIVIGPQGPSIPAGKLFARAPGGKLQVQSQASAALGSSHDGVAMAMNLLSDFHYHQLESDIRYQPDGALNLGLSFAGNNPAFFNGQATELNINLDYNLLDLLHSLRVTQNLVEELEQKYQPQR